MDSPKNRPTLALACIVKNEEHNLPVLLDSVQGCFDKIYICDTGSTDKTIEIAEKYGCVVTHFTWVNDFSAARNAAFSPVTEDYICWLDADDALNNKEEFIKWRDTIMETGDFWLNAYHYAHDEKGTPTCSFMRERVINRKFGFQWKYFVHEGIVPLDTTKKPRVSYVSSWSVKHRRSSDDLANDKGRNIRLFELHKDNLDPRMTYYYGKELFENGRGKEAIPYLLDATTNNDIEIHDRILGMQYLSYAFMTTGDFDQAVKVSLAGTQLSPHRAEFWCNIGDSYIKKNQILEALPFYFAAKSCKYNDSAKNNIAGPLFNFRDLYTHYPRNMITKIYCHMGKFEEAFQEAKECYDLFGNEETKKMVSEITRVKEVATDRKDAKEVDEIVISCHPQGLYEWDYGVYKSKGVGGSETAAVEMAYWLSKNSGKKVKVFNNVVVPRSYGDVEYIPAQEMALYLNKNKPYAHIAWRHNVQLTDAPTFLWCHDLLTPTAENTHYTKILVLSDFHKEFVKSLQNIPDDKILVTSNAIDPERFKDLDKTKVGNKVIWRSSPDRGLMRAIKVMDQVIKQVPDATLDIYYGFDNMRKNGKADEADAMMKEIESRPWITYRGNVEQKEMSKQCAKAKVWLYPTDFCETYCISALESLAEGIYPVVRKYGALQNTLKEAHESGMCDLISLDCQTDEEIDTWATHVVTALKDDSWKKCSLDLEKYSWCELSKKWLQFMQEARQ